MEVEFDGGKIRRLLTNLYALTGVCTTILDSGGKELFSCSERPAFCRLIRRSDSGSSRCQSCMVTYALDCREQKSFLSRCHAGLNLTVLPFQDDTGYLMYMVIGPYLDTSSLEFQWASLQQQLGWYPYAPEELKTAFSALQQCSSRQIDAFLELTTTLRDCIYISGAAVANHATDEQRLERYLDQHYTEKLSLSSISHDLNIGKTKLCALSKALPGAYTISQRITQRRIQRACTLLSRTNLPISEVSEAVGISDYNYFSKIFRQTTGVTPSKYRQTAASGRSWESH